MRLMSSTVSFITSTEYCALDENGLYVQDLYKFTDGDGGEKTTTEVKVAGQRIDYLPF